MLSFITLVQGLGLAYAAGLNLYAAVAVTGLAIRFGWVTNVPTSIEGFGNVIVIGVALVLYVIEFAATLIPGVSSAWETLPVPLDYASEGDPVTAWSTIDAPGLHSELAQPGTLAADRLLYNDPG